jgi:gluconokinase
MAAMVIILIGVAGSGKTTIGRILAARFGWEFHDGDDLHPRQNREKMHRGIALTDEDRLPWLHAIRDLVQRCLAESRCAVIACSALKQSYGDLLIVDPAKVKLVYLKGSQALITERLAHRAGHFFDPRLLQSQFDTLEEPADAIKVEISKTPEQIADEIRGSAERVNAALSVDVPAAVQRRVSLSTAPRSSALSFHSPALTF